MIVSIPLKLCTILVHIVDVFSDYYTGITYCQNGDVWWGSLTIGIAWIHSIVSTVYLLWTVSKNVGRYQFIWPAAHLARRISTLILCCSGFGPILIIVDNLIDTLKKRSNPSKEKLATQLSILALIEAIPQSCLQSYVLIQKTLSPPIICQPLKLGFTHINGSDDGDQFLRQISAIQEDVANFPSSGGCITFDNMFMYTVKIGERKANLEECKQACLDNKGCDSFYFESQIEMSCKLYKKRNDLTRPVITGRQHGTKFGKCFHRGEVDLTELFRGVIVTGRFYFLEGTRLFEDDDQFPCLLHFNDELNMVAHEYFLDRPDSELDQCYLIKQYLSQAFGESTVGMNILPLVKMLTSIYSAAFVISTKVYAPAFIGLYDRLFQYFLIKVAAIFFSFTSLIAGLLHVIVWFGLTAIIEKRVAFIFIPILACRLFIPAVCKRKSFIIWLLQAMSLVAVWCLSMNPQVAYVSGKPCSQMNKEYNLTANRFYEDREIGNPRMPVKYLREHLCHDSLASEVFCPSNVAMLPIYEQMIKSLLEKNNADYIPPNGYLRWLNELPDILQTNGDKISSKMAIALKFV